jgi:hypothetical protein
MPFRKSCLGIATLTLVAAGLSAASPAIEPRTAAAVQAADDAWGAAEGRGDAAFVDELLLPGYVSVGPAGKVTTKAAIVDGARKRGPSATMAAQIAAWKAAHPSRAEVTIVGDTAILRRLLTKPGLGEPVSSSDTFVYRGGHWRAIYSQHTTASD